MMKSRKQITSACLLGLTALVVACADEADKPTEADYEDLAESVAPLIRQELAADGGAVLSAQVAVSNAPQWLAVDGSGSAQGQAGSLSWSLSASCTDENNAPSDVCSETSASAQVASSLEGMLTLPNFSADLTAKLDWSISGLQTDTLVAEGHTSIQAATSSSGVFRPVMRSFDLDVDAQYDLLIPRNDPWLASGTVEASIDAHRRVVGTNRDSEAHFVVDAVVTFDGSGKAILTLDGAATFRLDLSSGALVHADARLGG